MPNLIDCAQVAENPRLSSHTKKDLLQWKSTIHSRQRSIFLVSYWWSRQPMCRAGGTQKNTTVWFNCCHKTAHSLTHTQPENAGTTWKSSMPYATRIYGFRNDRSRIRCSQRCYKALLQNKPGSVRLTRLCHGARCPFCHRAELLFLLLLLDLFPTTGQCAAVCGPPDNRLTCDEQAAMMPEKNNTGSATSWL